MFMSQTTVQYLMSDEVEKEETIQRINDYYKELDSILEDVQDGDNKENIQ